MNGYALLGLAIVLEIISTSMMKASVGFTKLLPSIVFILGMASSFYVLSQALVTVPLSIAYAIWSGVGTALTALIAVFIWKEHINVHMLIGISLIIAGVILLKFNASSH